MKKIIAQVIIILTIGLNTINSNAKEAIKVVTETWKPYNYQENGLVKGPSSDIVRAVLTKANLNYNIKVYPWARAYKIALKEKNTLIYSIARTPAREHLFKWIGPITGPDHIYLYKLSSNKKIMINTLDDAKPYRIGVVRNSMYHQFLSDSGFTNLQIVPHSQQNYKKLMIDRIDLLAEGKHNFQLEHQNLYKNFNTAVEEAFFLFSCSYYMAFNKETPDTIVNKVKEAFDQLIAEGTLNNIKFH